MPFSIRNRRVPLTERGGLIAEVIGQSRRGVGHKHQRDEPTLVSLELKDGKVLLTGLK
jgi:hypothetical protein